MLTVAASAMLSAGVSVPHDRMAQVPKRLAKRDGSGAVSHFCALKLSAAKFIQDCDEFGNPLGGNPGTGSEGIGGHFSGSFDWVLMSHLG